MAPSEPDKLFSLYLRNDRYKWKGTCGIFHNATERDFIRSDFPSRNQLRILLPARQAIPPHEAGFFGGFFLSW